MQGNSSVPSVPPTPSLSSVSQPLLSGAPLLSGVPQVLVPSWGTANIVGGMAGPLPVPATKYRADEADVMDIALTSKLRSLDAESLAVLWLRRRSQGKYEMDGRQITLRWRSSSSTDILVREDGISTESDMPLSDYLQQAANVAQLRIAPSQKLQVSARSAQGTQSRDTSPTKSENARSVYSENGEVDRIRSMHLACQEANLDLTFTV